MSHADIINKMVSKRLDKWRRDISEKRRRGKSKRYCIPMKLFNSKPPQKRMTKLKCSIYFLHLFFRFSLKFPNVKISNCFHHRSTDVCFQHTGKGLNFLLQWILPLNQLHGLCVNRSMASAVQRYMMPSVFFCSGNPERNATATQFWNSSGETVSTGTAWNRRLTRSENTARADPTPAVDANLFFKDVQYWKLKPKLKTIITT